MQLSFSSITAILHSSLWMVPRCQWNGKTRSTWFLLTSIQFQVHLTVPLLLWEKKGKKKKSFYCLSMVLSGDSVQLWLCTHFFVFFLSSCWLNGRAQSLASQQGTWKYCRLTDVLSLLFLWETKISSSYSLPWVSGPIYMSRLILLDNYLIGWYLIVK